MNKTIGAIAAVLIVLVLGAYWLHSAPISTNEIKIGVLLPLTGQFGALGEGIGNSIQIAANEYTNAHPNVHVTLVQEDDGFDVKKGIAAYEKLRDIDHIDALLMLSTPVLDALHETIQKDGLPVLSIGLQNDGVEPDNIFQLSAAPDLIIKGFSQLIVSSGPLPNAKHIAIVYSNNNADVSFYQTLLTVYSGAHDDFKVDAGSDYRTVATRIAAKSGTYDAVVFLTFPADGTQVVKNLLQQTRGHAPQLVFDAQLQTGWSEYQKVLGDMNALNGAYSLSLKAGDNAHIKEAYKTAYKQDMPVFADYGYDEFNALMTEYSADRATWLQNIQNTNTIGQSGKLSFDSNGVRVQDIGIFKVVNGVSVPD